MVCLRRSGTFRRTRSSPGLARRSTAQSPRTDPSHPQLETYGLRNSGARTRYSGAPDCPVCGPIPTGALPPRHQVFPGALEKDYLLPFELVRVKHCSAVNGALALVCDARVLTPSAEFVFWKKFCSRCGRGPICGSMFRQCARCSEYTCQECVDAVGLADAARPGAGPGGAGGLGSTGGPASHSNASSRRCQAPRGGAGDLVCGGQWTDGARKSAGLLRCVIYVPAALTLGAQRRPSGSRTGSGAENQASDLGAGGRGGAARRVLFMVWQPDKK